LPNATLMVSFLQESTQGWGGAVPNQRGSDNQPCGGRLGERTGLEKKKKRKQVKNCPRSWGETLRVRVADLLKKNWLGKKK